MRAKAVFCRLLAVELSLAASGGFIRTADADCSCTAMTVSHATAAPTKICSNADFPDVVNTGECASSAGSPLNGCAGYKHAYSCKNGVNTQTLNGAQPSQHTGFGIEATIAGIPGDCRSGHSLQENITSNGNVEPNPSLHDIPPTEVVTVGAWQALVLASRMPAINEVPAAAWVGKQIFGADNYSNPNANDVLIQASNQHIAWWDNPDQTKDDTNEDATWHFRYFSYVLGRGANATSCGCVYEIKVSWAPKQAPATTYQKDAASPQCHF